METSGELFARSAATGRGLVLPLLLRFFSHAQTAVTVWNDVEHGYAANGDVKIHYPTLGEGPLVIMIHGFPDFWYTGRHQMSGLKGSCQRVAIDQRGLQPQQPA